MLPCFKEPGRSAAGRSNKEHAYARNARSEVGGVHLRTNACCAPAMHHGGRCRARALAKTLQERQCPPTEATPDLNPEDAQFAPSRTLELRVGSVLPVEGLVQGDAWLRISLWSGLPVRKGLTIVVSTASWAQHGSRQQRAHRD